MTVQLFVVLTPADHSSPASCSVKCCEFSSPSFSRCLPQPSAPNVESWSGRTIRPTGNVICGLTCLRRLVKSPTGAFIAIGCSMKRAPFAIMWAAISTSRPSALCLDVGGCLRKSAPSVIMWRKPMMWSARTWP